MPIPKRKIDPSNKQKLFEKLLGGSTETRASQKKQQAALKKELEADKAKRKTPKFNSKGQSVSKITANKEVEKKPTAKKKVTTKKKVTAKKPEAKKPEAKKPEAKKPEAKKKVTAKKPTVKKPEAKKKVTAKKKPPSKLAKSLKAARGTPATPKATKALTRSLKDGRSTPKPKPKAATEKLKTSLRTSARSKPQTPTSAKNKLLQSIKDSRAKPNAGKASVKANPKTTPTKTSSDSKMKQSLRGARGKPLTPNAHNVGPAGERIGGNPTTSKTSSKLGKIGKGILRFGGPLAALSAGKMLYDTVHPDEVKKRSGESKAGFGTKKKKAVVKKKAETTAEKPTSKVTSTAKKKDTTKKKATTTSSFGTAFKTARKAGKSKFSWNGKSYSTATKDDVKASGSKDLREHLNKQNKKSK